MNIFFAENIGLHYPGRPDPAFRDLSLTLCRGENLRLTGPSGAGKTSLMRLIAGLEQPTSGRITIQPRQIGMAFAEPRLLPRLSALENLLFIAPNARSGAREMLAALDMGALQNAPADSLSKGQAQRVALIRALLIRLEILLLDEALGGLDMPTWQSSRDLVQAQRDRDGFALIEITHDTARLIARMPGQFLLPEERIPHAKAAASFPPSPRSSGRHRGLADHHCPALSDPTDQSRLAGLADNSCSDPSNGGDHGLGLATGNPSPFRKIHFAQFVA